jgi:hypothetical protein
MARQPDKSHKLKHRDKHEAEGPPAQRKSPRFSQPYRPSSNPVAQYPAKEPAGVSKSEKSVNIAGVFKKSKHDEKKHRKHKKRTPTPEPDLADQVIGIIFFALMGCIANWRPDGIEEARAAIDTKLRTSFDAVHEEFKRKLADSRARDMAFFESISATANILTAPLAEEQIETTFTRQGKRVTEIVEIGKRMAQFRKSVETDEAKLKDFWKQWEDLQDEFIELGMEVFGPEAFGGAPAGGKASDKGFKKEMELLDIEHNVKVQELNEEVETIAGQMLVKMKESEKVRGVDESFGGMLMWCIAIACQREGSTGQTSSGTY